MNDTLFLIGPNDIGRAGLAMVLADVGLDVVSLSDNVNHLVADGVQPHLALIDFDRIDRTLDAIEDLKEMFEDVYPVVLAERFDFGEMLECFKAGANGYILKTISSERLAASLRLAALGEKVMPSDVADLLPPRVLLQKNGAELAHALPGLLSMRELDVIRGLKEGYANKIIARQLHVSEATIKVHVKAILRKLKVANRTQAALWATSHDLATARTLGTLDS